MEKDLLNIDFGGVQLSKRTAWADQAYKLSEQGLTSSQIHRKIIEEYGDVSWQAVRSSIKRDRKRNGTQRDCSGRPTNAESERVTEEARGIKVFDDITKVDDGTEITPTTIMARKGLVPEEWEVISFTRNFWQQQNKDGEAITLCQSKLTVKPVKKGGITFEDIDKWFNEKKFEDNFEDIKPLNYNRSKEVLEIDVADLHVGLLAWRYETNNDWDLHICKEKFLQGVKDIVERSKGREFSCIYLCTLGDVIHVDNMQGTTTKGTVQQTDGRVTKIFDFAYDTMVQAIDMLRELNAPIKYVYLCGNHDMVIGYCLAKMLQATIRDVEFDVEPKPQKAIHFGKCLVGLCHGDMPKYNKGQWLMNDYRREFGNSDFAEEHSGHFHTEEAKTYNGVMCRSVMAQCGNSYWENSQGYRSQRGIQCFVWNKDKGLRETWYYFY